MSYISSPFGATFSLFKTTTDASTKTQCGQRFVTEDGREVVIVENAAVALPAGVLVQNSPIVPNHQGLGVVSFKPLDPVTGIPATLVVTLGATVSNENQYMGGYVVVVSGTGMGQTLKIEASTPTAASGDMTILLEDNPVVALDVTSEVDLIVEPYAGVVLNPTTPTASPAGVTLYAIPASVLNTYDAITGKLILTGTPVFGFVVTKGITACLSDVTVAAAGLGIMPSTTTAGSVTLATATGATIGSAYVLGVSAETHAVYINL